MQHIAESEDDGSVLRIELEREFLSGSSWAYTGEKRGNQPEPPEAPPAKSKIEFSHRLMPSTMPNPK